MISFFNYEIIELMNYSIKYLYLRSILNIKCDNFFSFFHLYFLMLSSMNDIE